MLYDSGPTAVDDGCDAVPSMEATRSGADECGPQPGQRQQQEEQQ